jgi:hypothetical protein
MHWMKLIMPVLLTVALSVTPALCKTDDMVASEYRIKAAFLYNFARFVSWPDSDTGNNGFSICVLGTDPFGELVDSLAGKQVHNQELVIRRLSELTPEDNCQLVYISSENMMDLDATLSLLRANPVLTVSDMDDFHCKRPSITASNDKIPQHIDTPEADTDHTDHQYGVIITGECCIYNHRPD